MQPAIIQIAIPPNTTNPALPPHTLTCYEWGNPSAPHTLLCLHGLTRTGRDFDFVAQALTDKFRILCPDMPGRGRSDHLPPECYQYDTYLADINVLISQLKLKHIHLLGTSMGGILGMMLANHTPGLIKSLILNDVGCMIPADGLHRILRYAGKNMEFHTLEEAHTYLRNVCASFGVKEEKHWQHFLQNSLNESDDGKITLHYDPAIIAALQSTEITDVNLWPLWDAVKPIPTLLIRGQQSDILTEETATQMAQSHPDIKRYNIADTGHAPALMAGEQIGKLKEWLASRT